MNLINNAKSNAVEGFCIIKSIEQKVTQRGQTYLDITLSDATGEVNAKLWDYNESKHGKYSADDVVKVRGTLDTWNNNPQVRIEKIRPAVESDNVKYDDLVESAPYSAERMYSEIERIVSAFENVDLKELVMKMLSDNRESLMIFPAAVKLHHAMRGGLLYHTLSIIRMAQRACELYTFLDRELLISGAILHDMAKIGELEVTTSGYASGYTQEGQLIGHLVKGAVNIELAARELGTNRDTVMLLQHMVISHHGKPEFGSPILPMFSEAYMLSALDELDAAMYEIMSAIDSVAVGEFSQRQWALDQRKIYNHGRGGFFKSNVID